MRRLMAGLAVLAVLAAGASAALYAAYTRVPARPAALVVVDIPPGTGVNAIAERLAAAGVLTGPRVFALMTRLDGRARRLRAGEYAIALPKSPRAIADLLIDGKVLLHPVTLVDGWTVAESLKMLGSQDFLRQDLGVADEATLLARLGLGSGQPEGRFYPDTYDVPRGTPASQVLKTAHAKLTAVLDLAWAERAPGLAVTSADEALVLASLIEKETAAPEERALISAVFHNRLRSGMRLQTDPSVIYGLGARYDGTLHHADLQSDTPYNTYTRTGLPPTPIALAGRPSLVAALHPADSTALYFVARGDGSGRHVFSATLAEHNRAVSAYLARLREARAGGAPP